MDVTIHEKGGSKVAVIKSDETVIGNAQDALDLMATIRYQYACDKIAVEKSAVIEAFFDLKTGVAGEILQKYANYRFKLALVGDFSVYTSKSLKDFIYESNKGSQVFFVADENNAIERLHAAN